VNATTTAAVPHRRTGGTIGVWWVTLTAVAIAVYAPLPYLTAGVDGLAAGGHEVAANWASRPGWVQGVLYAHMLFAGAALLLAPVQLSARLRSQAPRVHRATGRVVVICLLAGGTAGLVLAPMNFAGPIGAAGFGALALLSIAFPVLGVRAIRQGDAAAHRRWMLRAFAMIYAGVMLRLWLPVLVQVFDGDFARAYSFVPFLCWVPNLLAVELVLRRRT
jgi:uncharacterized membrane protein